MRKFSFTILVLLLIQGTIHANVIDDLRKDYFGEFNFYDSGYVIKFKKNGARFFIEKNNEPSRLSQYEEVLKVDKEDCLTLISRGGSIHIFHYDKMDEKDKMRIKKTEAFKNVYLIVRDGMQKSKVFVFITDSVTDDQKIVITRVLKENPDLLIEEQGNLIVAQDISKAVSEQSEKKGIVY